MAQSETYILYYYGSLLRLIGCRPARHGAYNDIMSSTPFVARLQRVRYLTIALFTNLLHQDKIR